MKTHSWTSNIWRSSCHISISTCRQWRKIYISIFRGSLKESLKKGARSESSVSMLQLHTFIQQQPSTILASSSVLHLSEWPSPHNDDAFLAMEEAEHEEKLAEIRNANSNLPILGRIMDNDQEEYEGEPDDEEADNADESEGDEFEQETG